jgi:hypothetical protein
MPGKYLAYHGAQEWGDHPMSDREPEPRESGALAPFLWIETAQGDVEMWALGEDRFRITAPGHEQLVTGFDEVERAADALAEQLRVRARAEG